MANDISKKIIQSFAEIAKDKDIGKDRLLSILEGVFRTMIRKKYGSDDAFEVILNADRGEIQILHISEVVPKEELTEEVQEVAIEEAKKQDRDPELYEAIPQQLTIQVVG